MAKKISGEKFQFDIDFQENLLRFTITDKDGYKMMEMYEDHYFTLIEHQVIAKTLKSYYKLKQRLPKDKSLLKERLRKLYMTKDFIDLQDQDRKSILKIINRLYSGPCKDGPDILDEALKFRQYIQLKHELEGIDLNNYAQYGTYSEKIRKAITFGNSIKQDSSTLLFADSRQRQADRASRDNIHPTPFWQINRLTNAGGFETGSVVCLMGPEKRFKTGLLANIGKGYLRMRKRVLFIDLENGKEGIALRFEQSLLGATKKEVLTGKHDDRFNKIARKYKRLGAEVDIKRMPAYSTTAKHIEEHMDYQYREYGLTYEVLIIDYIGLMGSLSGTKDEFQRISDAYVDCKNLGRDKKLDVIYTANHITRDGKKREESIFVSNDLAKCIDIARHVDALFGFNQSEQEKLAGVARLEVVEQRDGKPEGRAYFYMDIELQRAKEFTKQDVEIAVSTRYQSDQEDVKKKKNGDL